MAKHEVMVDKAVRYMELEYPSLVKYKFKMGIIIYNNKNNFPKNVTVVDLINAMSIIIQSCLTKERLKKEGGVKW